VQILGCNVGWINSKHLEAAVWPIFKA
jgi:hypothetical protein